jgi:hypothetical protein
MIKLKDILLEIELGEAIVKVPQEVLAKSKEAFNYIKQYLEHFKTQAPKDYYSPNIYPKFENYFKFKDLKNQDLIVSIGLYSDPEDDGNGRMNTRDDILLINLAHFNPEELEDFEDLIEHELVHAMDPKLRDIHVYKGVAKKGATGGKESENLDKYLKSPWEFDAFTAPLINKLKFNLAKFPNDNTYKDLLIQLLSDIKTKSIEQVANDNKYDKLPWFFSKKEWNKGNWASIHNTYTSELYKLKAWSTKPTLYQRFTKRLGTELI